MDQQEWEKVNKGISFDEDIFVIFTGKLSGIFHFMSMNLSKVETWVIQADGGKDQVIKDFDGKSAIH